MFNNFYSNFYRFLKSGFLLDFIVKKISFFIAKKLFFVSNIIFSEKFITEYFFLRYSKYINYIVNFFEFFSNNFIFVSLFYATLLGGLVIFIIIIIWSV